MDADFVFRGQYIAAWPLRAKESSLLLPLPPPGVANSRIVVHSESDPPGCVVGTSQNGPGAGTNGTGSTRALSRNIGSSATHEKNSLEGEWAVPIRNAFFIKLGRGGRWEKDSVERGLMRIGGTKSHWPRSTPESGKISSVEFVKIWPIQVRPSVT